MTPSRQSDRISSAAASFLTICWTAVWFAVAVSWLPAADAQSERRPIVQSGAPSNATPTKSLRFGIAGDSRDSQFEGLKLAVFSAELSEDTIQIRVGFVSSGSRPLTGRLVLDEADFNLLGSDYLATNVPQKMAPSLKMPIPEKGLAPGLATAGTLQFALPAHTGKLSLQVTGFPDLPLDIDNPVRQFEPVGLSGLGISTPLALKVYSQEGALSVIPWRIHAINSNERETTFRMSFTNEARSAINWVSRLTGKSARLLDSEGALHSPSHVSDSLAAEIGPMREPWKAGFENGGTVTFPTPHLHAAQSMQLMFPGYPPIRIDLEFGRFIAAAKAVAPVSPTNLPPAAAAERAYRGINQMVITMGQALAAENHEAFLTNFADIGQLRVRQDRFFRGVAQAPVGNISYSLPPNQRFQVRPDGSVHDVLLMFRYHILGASADNEFVSIQKASLAPGPTPSGWQIVRLATISRPPFWELGYTGLRTTDHFLIFYPPATESEENVNKTAAQVEKSYKELERRGFVLEKRYPAFFIPSRNDFQAMTTRDPEKFSGVASAAYSVKDGQIVSTNRAMYINDYRYLVQQKVWGLQDRQKTITHELVHLALANHTRPYTPAWIVEGMAVHHAKQTNNFTRAALRDSRIASRFTLGDMSLSPILGQGIPDKTVISLMYNYSGEVTNYLVKRFGHERVLNFYKAFGKPDAAEMNRFAKTQTYTASGQGAGMEEITFQMTQRLVPAHFGLSLEELTQIIRRELKLK